ncbi:hypothetical protein BC629DRAFT_1000661 [Irpex lacteus]|nr:hypothetical protein BC629DRAFT_1000661 [Irpex lacteus]
MKRSTLLISAVISMSMRTAAQDWTVPNTWRKPTTDLSLSERLSLVDKALQSFNTHRPMNTTTGLFQDSDPLYTASVVSGLSVGDYFNRSSTNSRVALAGISAMISGKLADPVINPELGL